MNLVMACLFVLELCLKGIAFVTAYSWKCGGMVDEPWVRLRKYSMPGN